MLLCFWSKLFAAQTTISTNFLFYFFSMVLLALHPNISDLNLFSIKSVLSEINVYINMEN